MTSDVVNEIRALGGHVIMADTVRESHLRLAGDRPLLSSAELGARAFVAAALPTAETQTFEIGGRMVAAGPRDRVGGQLLAVVGDSRRSGIDAVLPAGRRRASLAPVGFVGAMARAWTGEPGWWCWA